MSIYQNIKNRIEQYEHEITVLNRAAIIFRNYGEDTEESFCRNHAGKIRGEINKLKELLGSETE